MLAERCRRLLVAHRPDHCFAATATPRPGVATPQVAAALKTLQHVPRPYRPVQHLLLRAEAARSRCSRRAACR